MKEIKTQFKDLGFTSGHAHLLLVAVAFFAVLFVAQSDISLRALFANADSEVTMITYEDMHAKIASEYGGINLQADAEAERQLALLDRSLDSGKVLGDVVGIGAIPSVDNIFTRAQLDTITVTTVATNNNSVQKYAEDVLGVESQNGAVELMANLNSSDISVLRKTEEQVSVINSKLKGLTAPSELADFHRYKMIYYQSLASMANAFATNTLDTNFQNTSKIMFSVIERIEQGKNEIQNKYQVSL